MTARDKTALEADGPTTPNRSRDQDNRIAAQSIALHWMVHGVPTRLIRGSSESGMLRRISCLIAGTVLLHSAPASAQYAPVDTTSMGQTATGVMANKLSGEIANKKARSHSVSSRCSADSGPGPERRAMEAQYGQLLKSSGRQRADAWRAEHGRRYRAKLQAEGKCR